MTIARKSIAAITLLVELVWMVVRPVWTVTDTQALVYSTLKDMDGVSTVDAASAVDQQFAFASAFGGFPRTEDGMLLMQASEVLSGLMIGTAIIGGVAAIMAPHIRREIGTTATQESVTSE